MIAIGQPLHRAVRTRHAGYVLVTLAVTGVLLLGMYEAMAGYVNPEASVLFPPDEAGGSVATAADAPVRWLTMDLPTRAYWPDESPAWIAVPGERYRVVQEEGGWVLAFAEGDSPHHLVWMQLDPWVHLSDE